MKKLILIALLLPFLSFGQRFDIAETAGFSLIPANNFFSNTSSLAKFSNQVSIGYRIVPHFAVSVFYEYEAWPSALGAFGITPDVIIHHYYFGVDLKEAHIQPENGVTYKTSLGYGIHAGGNVRLYKHLFFNAQAGFGYLYFTTTETTGGFSSQSSNTILYPYLRIGLLYRL